MLVDVSIDVLAETALSMLACLMCFVGCLCAHARRYMERYKTSLVKVRAAYGRDVASWWHSWAMKQKRQPRDD